MSVIAWDRAHIASDRQATQCDMRRPVQKLFQVDGDVLGMTGQESGIFTMLEWWKHGALPATYPKQQEDNERWNLMIVANVDGVVVYEQSPFPYKLDPEETPFFAWGSGRDYAMGAMGAGASAMDAVRITNKFCVNCGMGVDAYGLLTLDKLEVS